MSVSSQITRLSQAKAAIKAAIKVKGVDVPDATLLDGMADAIKSIPSKDNIVHADIPDYIKTAALEVADDVLRVCGCDLKAISYFASYLPLIEDRKFKPEQHIRVLSNTRPYQGGMEYENSFGGVKYRLPYLPIVEEQAATLKLLEPLAGKEAKSYEPVIAAIAAEVFGDGK